ncbi:MAG: DUF1127 domain-containing protein [Rhodospirillaceae bacterium]|nr:DUF1127 domain-containing protein [Rhodospirillaceae bacterium]MBT5811704.1 DUF1127 domain-containing protein [Rhodospirillaceae bacterium]
MNAMEQTLRSSPLIPMIEKLGVSLCVAVQGAVFKVAKARRRPRTVRNFEALDDRVLRDIGFTRNGGRLH